MPPSRVAPCPVQLKAVRAVGFVEGCERQLHVVVHHITQQWSSEHNMPRLVLGPTMQSCEFELTKSSDPAVRDAGQPPGWNTKLRFGVCRAFEAAHTVRHSRARG